MFACDAIANAQAVIDLEVKATIRFDGKSESELRVEAALIDGFTYRIPVELTVSDGVKLNDLNGKTICQCASLQFDKKSIAGQNEVVTGQILLRPKSSDLVQILDAYGTTPGELDPVIIGRVKLNCKTYSPVRLTPSVVEVTNKRFPHSSIELHVSKGVEIVEAKMSDSNSTIKAVFDHDKNLFQLDAGDSLTDPEGELVADFVFTYKGKKANYVARVPYAPKPAVRVVPSTVTFRAHVTDGYVGRLIVIGFGPSETDKPTLMLEKLANGVWEKTNIEFEIDQFRFGRAIGRFVLPSNQTLVDSDERVRMRLVDKGTNITFVELGGVLVK